MTTVAPSAPAPVAAPTAVSGETADPAAFAAEFESALGSLVTSLTAPAAPTPYQTAESVASPTLDLAVAAASTDVDSVISDAGALPTPVATGTEGAPLPTPALYQTTESTALPTADLAATPLPAADDSVVSHVSSTVSLAAPVETDDDADAEAAAPDAPAEALPAALELPVPPVSAPPQLASRPSAQSAPAADPTPAVAAASRPAPDTVAPAEVPAVAPAVSAAAPAPAVAAPVAPAQAPPLQAPAVTSTDEVAAPAAPVRAPAPDLVGQLSRPIQGLRSFGDGTHIITVRVTPENLGPVAVHAHVSGDSMRIELVAPTDQARDALKSILGDLRRDLSGAGGQATLDLSSGSQSSGRESAQRDNAPTSRGSESFAPAPATGIRTPVRSDAALDVLA